MRAAAQGPMPLHVFHLAVIARVEPAQQVLLVFGNLHAGHAQLTEAERPGARNQRLLCRVEVKNFKVGHGEGTGVSIITAWLCRSLCIPLHRYVLSTRTQSTSRVFLVTR